MKRNLPAKIRLEVLFSPTFTSMVSPGCTFSGTVILYVLLYITVAVSGRTSNNALMSLRALCTALWLEPFTYEIEQNNGQYLPQYSPR